MRFFIVFGWGGNNLAGRAFDDHGLADAKAQTYNAVLVEVHVCDVDLQTYVLAHDYEYRNKAGESQAVIWVDEGHSFSIEKGWVPRPPPFIRVGTDIGIERYSREHKGHA